MKAQYRITEDNYAAVARFHAWRHLIASTSRRQLLPASIAVALVIISVWMRPSIAPAVAFGAVVFVMFTVVLTLGVVVVTPIRARRQYRKYKAIQEPITVELTDSGVRLSNGDGGGTLSWSKILQWRQSDQFVLIYAMPVLFYIVPKSIARDGFDVPLLIQRLAEHVGAES